MKKLFPFLSLFLLAFSGLLIPLACTSSSYFAPTKPDNPSLGLSPTPTPTNLNGYTSTPTSTGTPTFTPTSTPTPAPTLVSTSTPVGVVNAPNGLALGNSSIYVAGGDGTLSIFPSAGGGSTPFTNFGTTTFGSLYGVAVDSTSGNYYVLDNTNGAVYEFTSSNNPVTSWTNYTGADGTVFYFNKPEGIGVDPLTEYVYVADTGNNEIEVFKADSTAVTEWGGLGAGNGTFDNPTGISFNGSTIYVSDASNGLIQEFTLASGFVTQFSTVTGSDVDSVSADGNGNIYAADYAVNSGPGQVEQYNSNGKLTAQWNGPNAPFGPDGVVVNSAGTTLLVTDYDSQALYQISP